MCKHCGQYESAETDVNESMEGLSQPDKTTPDGGVTVEMSRFGELLDTLEKSIDLHESRVTPVLRQSQANAKDYDRKDRPSSDLGGWLSANNVRLEMMLDHIQHMTNRVDL